MYSHAPTGRKSSGGRPPVAHAGRAHEATEPQKPREGTRAGPQTRTAERPNQPRAPVHSLEHGLSEGCVSNGPVL